MIRGKQKRKDVYKMQLLKCGALSINEMIKINDYLVKTNAERLTPCDNLKELVMIQSLMMHIFY